MNPVRYTRTGAQEVKPAAMLGYQAANRMSQIDGLSFTAGFSGDAHEDISREKIVAASRYLMRENPIYRGMIGRIASYVVGKGFGLQARTADDDWNAEAERLWNKFWQSPEIRGNMSGKRYEVMVYTEMLVAGEVFQLFVKDSDGIRLQLFESEQCVPAHMKRDNGVVLDEYGRATGYNLQGYDVNGYVRRGKQRIQKANNVIHLYDAERASSSRGMPAFQSAFSMLFRLNDICDAESIARQMLSHLALSVTRNDATAQAYQESSADNGNSEFRVQQLDYATIFHCGTGESINAINRNIPGGDFQQAMTMFLRVIGLPRGLPLEIVLLDWTKSNYSQSRAVLQQAFETFAYDQNLLKSRSMSVIYQRKIAEWVTSGKLAARPDMDNHEWIAPAFPWLDESKEIQAQAKKMELGVVSHSEICKTLQHERADVVDQRESEVVDAIERAQRVKETTGVLPPWQMFAGLPLQNAHLFEESPPPAQGDEAVEVAPEQPALEESDDVES